MSRHRTVSRDIAKGRMGTARDAWVTLDRYSFIHYARPAVIETQAGESHDYVSHTLMIQAPNGGRPVTMNLTDMTLVELELLEQMIQRSINLARPECAAYDEIAKEAFENGDDTFLRHYRAIPELVVRERPPAKHGAGVQSGPDGAAGGDGGDALVATGPEDGAVRDGEQADVGTEDDAAEARDVPDVGQVGG